MNVYPISEDMLTLSLSPEELRGRGLSSGRLESWEAAALAREACQSYGLEGRPVEVESFCSPGGVLLFARLEPEPAAVVFPSLGVLLDALSALTRPLEATVFRTPAGEYYIQAAGEQAAPLLEFGQATDLPAGEPLLSRAQCAALQAALVRRGG